jgi:hypothetical protein
MRGAHRKESLVSRMASLFSINPTVCNQILDRIWPMKERVLKFGKRRKDLRDLELF